MNKEKRIHVFISGRVQGVFFRAQTAAKARSLDLKGWVKNLEDGRVEIIFEGQESAIKQAVKWIKNISLPVKLENLEIIGEPYQGEFNHFKIRR